MVRGDMRVIKSSCAKRQPNESPSSSQYQRVSNSGMLLCGCAKSLETGFSTTKLVQLQNYDRVPEEITDAELSSAGVETSVLIVAVKKTKGIHSPAAAVH